MKYVVVLGDGMADLKIKELGDKTPLQAAKTPNMDKLAQKGEVGLTKNIPEGFPPGSDVANLSVIGYNPADYYTGRSPIEAVSMGVDLDPEDVAFRVNLVTLSEDEKYEDKTMVDYSADEISTEEARVLMETIQKELGTEIIEFHGGISYRHLMVWRKGEFEFELTPPHDISDRKITGGLPKGKESSVLLELMEKSYDILSKHPINLARIEKGLRPANSMWLWGQGKKPTVDSFGKKYGITGSVISAVDLTKGLGLCAGLEVIEVEGATGNISTNFKGKGEAAINELKKGKDLVYIHVEAPDEAGHRGEMDTKIKAIEEIDEKVLGTVLEGLEEFEDYKVMVLPDHPTPLSLKTHTSDPVPYIIYQKGDNKQEALSFDEEQATSQGVKFPQGFKLMDHFIGK